VAGAGGRCSVARPWSTAHRPSPAAARAAQQEVHQAKQVEAAAIKALGQHEVQVTELKGKLAASTITCDDLQAQLAQGLGEMEQLSAQLAGVQGQLGEAQQELEGSRAKVRTCLGSLPAPLAAPGTSSRAAASRTPVRLPCR
jgi:chromosome segregation ATPase